MNLKDKTHEARLEHRRTTVVGRFSQLSLDRASAVGEAETGPKTSFKRSYVRDNYWRLHRNGRHH